MPRHRSLQAPFVPRSEAPAWPVRMIALDIDGTLVDDGLELGDRTKAAVAEAVRRGIHVSIATGRMTRSASSFARQLGIVDPVIGYQGGLIRELGPDLERLGRLLLHRPLPADVARDAVRWSREMGFDPHINHLERLIIPADDPSIDDYSAFLGTKAVRAPDLLAWIRRPVTKVIAVGAEGHPMRALGAAREHFAGRADVTVAHPRFLEFVAPGVSKGMAVRWLARRHGIPMGQVLAIGDHLNDVEMLSAVGHGAAMPHAPAAVLEVARYICPPLREQGAAQLIEGLALAAPAAAQRRSAELEAAATELRGAA